MPDPATHDQLLNATHNAEGSALAIAGVIADLYTSGKTPDAKLRNQLVTDIHRYREARDAFLAFVDQARVPA